jgi:hypothetical protein
MWTPATVAVDNDDAVLRGMWRPNQDPAPVQLLSPELIALTGRR